MTFASRNAVAHDSPGQHWNRQSVQLRDESGDPRVREALLDAATAWNQATPELQLTVVDGVGSGCRGADGEVQVCLTRSDDAAATTERHGEGGHIRRAEILIDAVRSGGHLRAVACHEVGHAVGVGHRDSGATCMLRAPTIDRPDEADLRTVRDAHAGSGCERRSLATHNGRCLVPLG